MITSKVAPKVRHFLGLFYAGWKQSGLPRSVSKNPHCLISPPTPLPGQKISMLNFEAPFLNFVSAEVVELFPQPLTLPKQTNIGFLGIFETTLGVDIVVLDSLNEPGLLFLMKYYFCLFHTPTPITISKAVT